jgi:hypothetical protein
VEKPFYANYPFKICNLGCAYRFGIAAGFCAGICGENGTTGNAQKLHSRGLATIVENPHRSGAAGG